MFLSKPIIFASASCLIEWFEFSLFAYLAPTLNIIFFPLGENSLFYTYTIFAIGIFIRPFASLLSGYIADKYGRQKILLSSVLIMSLSSASIAILPNYALIGIYAPILLIVFRIMQGFAIAIEHNNASNYIIEQHSNKLFASSIFSAMGALGIALSCLSVSLLDIENFPNSWRYLFFISSITSFIVYFFRRNLPESIEYLKTKNLSKSFKDIYKRHFKSLIIAIIFTSFFAVFFYIGNIYLFGHLVKHGNYSLNMASKISSYNYLLIACLTIFIAYRNKFKPFSLKYLSAAIVIIIIISPLLFYVSLLGPRKIYLIEILLMFFSASHTIYTINLYFLLYKLFPANIRCMATNFTYSFPIAIFGGTAPLIAEKLVINKLNYGPGIYISLLGIICLIAYRTSFCQKLMNEGI